LIRPPGSRGKEIALSLAEYLSESAGNITCISVGDLIDKEISKRSSYGKEIEQSRQTYSFVKDEIVIELLKLQVQQMENEQKSYIIEGFPRTETQAIAMQKMGILPDNFILLNQSDDFSEKRIRDLLQGDDTIVKCEHSNHSKYAKHAIRENNVNMKGVKDVCSGLITELDGTKSEQQILEEIVRVLKLKRTKAPRRPQRVILMGPPGSGTEHQAIAIAQKYKLVYVQVTQMLKDAIRREGDTQLAIDLAARLQANEPLPDDIIIDLVRDRLERPDCRTNGWILEGCPMNQNQIKQIRDLMIVPQVVVAFELSDQAVMTRNAGVAPEQLEKRLNDYRDFLAVAETEFNQFLIRINAEE